MSHTSTLGRSLLLRPKSVFDFHRRITLPLSFRAPNKTSIPGSSSSVHCSFEYSALAFHQKWGCRIGVFPEGEEVFVGGKRPDVGRIGIRSLQSSRLQSLWMRRFSHVI